MNPELEKKLAELFALIKAEAINNKDFESKLNDFFNIHTKERKIRRRTSWNPIELAMSGVTFEELEHELRLKDIEELKDVIVTCGMNQDRLALKWKDKDRLIERILNVTKERVSKGDAFRNPKQSADI